MKKTKALVILCMVALMGIASTMPSTFSWYTRADDLTGGKARYKRDNLPISAGSISNVNTHDYSSADGKIVLDSRGVKQELSSFTQTVAKGNTQYYKTTLTNNSNGDVYADMFLRSITNSARVFIGTISPVITEKQVGVPTRHSISNSKTMIYFQCVDANTGTNQWANKTNIYLFAKSPDSNGVLAYSPSIMTKVEEADGYKKKGTGSKVETFYAELPENTTEFYFAQTSSSPSGFKRTRTFSSFHPSVLYYLTGKTTDDNNKYAECLTYDMNDALVVPTYYDSVTTSAKRSCYLSLPTGTKGDVEYELVADTGFTVTTSANVQKLTVTSTSEEILELDTITGKVKVKSENAEGRKVKTTVTGPIGDTAEFTTTINVPGELYDFPICRNIYVEKKSKTVVEWYVANKNTANVDADLGTLFITK